MIDLHTHTNESDGTLSPEQLIAAAKRSGIQTLSITDHDTLAGHDQAILPAQQHGVFLICGIEITAYYRNRIQHVLGYFPERDPDRCFRDWVESLSLIRLQRNLEILRKLRLQGCEVTPEELHSLGKMPGRPHIAKHLVKKGYATSIQNAFDRYLDASAACYEPGNYPGIIEVLDRLSDAGGVSVLAHPYKVSHDLSDLEASVEEMRNWGLRGIEVYHSNHSREQSFAYLRLATRLGLAITAGSDFHGDHKPNVSLGVNIEEQQIDPAGILAGLRVSQGAMPHQVASYSLEAIVVASSRLVAGESLEMLVRGQRLTARLRTIFAAPGNDAANDIVQPQPIADVQLTHVQLTVDPPFPSVLVREVCGVELFQPGSPVPLSRGLTLGTACKIGTGVAIWFTGLSGAGKTTIATGVAQHLEARGVRTALLDGDLVREHLNKDLGFSQSDREENVRRLGFTAKLLVDAGTIVLISAISPHRKLRDEVREHIPAFMEVFVNAPLSVCEQRDVKGLYQRARRGEIKHFTGVSDVYEAPLNPDVECHTDIETVAESVTKVTAVALQRIADRSLSA